MATYNYVTVNGTIIPDTSVIQSEVEAEYIDALGLEGPPDPSSNEGRLIDAETTSRISVARNNAALANQINPNLSTGTFLDALLALLGSARDGAEQSTVECDLTGVAGTIIPAGQYAQDDNLQLWELVEETTLDVAGQATATFRSVEFGEISAAAGTITKINTGVTGWETVNNPNDAVPGKLQQTDVSARQQRLIELGGNARSVSFAIIAAVNALEGVAGVQFRENNTDSPQVIDSVNMIARSTWVCVDGGATSEIVEAYYPERWGTEFNGAVSDDYVDPISGQTITVKFDRPTDKPLICRVTAIISKGTASIDDIKEAVVAYANGEVDGELGFFLGEDSSPFEVSAGINAQLDTFITKVELATVAAGPGSYSTDTIDNEIFEKASIIKADVEVVDIS